MEPYWNLIEEIVKESDIVLNILDARLVEESRNKKIEEIIKEKKRPVIYVLNKADLISRKDLEWKIDDLKRETGKEIVYVSNRQRRTIKTLLAKIRQMFAEYGKRPGFVPEIKKPYREAKGDIVVGVVGYPNVGKSSIINSLSFKKKVKVSKKAGTTHGIHWVKAGDEIKLIDTPGVIPLEKPDEARLGMIAARSPDRIKEPDLVAAKIISMFLNEKKLEKLGYFYSVKIPEEMNAYEILEFIAKEKKHLKKGGVADEIRTAMMIVKDWQDGRLKL